MGNPTSTWNTIKGRHSLKPGNPRYINHRGEYFDDWAPGRNVLTQPPESTETRLRTVYFPRDDETTLTDTPQDKALSSWLNQYGIQRTEDDLWASAGGKPDRVLLVLREFNTFLFLVLQKNGLESPPQHDNLDEVAYIDWEHIGDWIILGRAAGMTNQEYDLVGLQRIENM